MKRKPGIIVVLVLAVLALLSSCTTRTTVYSGFLFQRMAEEGSYLVTSRDPSLLENFITLDDSISNKIRRFSVSFTGGTYSALIEGELSKTTFDLGMFFSQEYNKKTGESWYTDKEETIRLNLPENDCLIATNGSYAEAEGLVFPEYPENYISDEDALIMANADLAVYGVRPTDLPAIPLFVGNFSAKGIEKIMIWSEGGKLYLRAEFETEKLASSFNKLLKLAYVAKIKKSGVSYTLDELKNQFIENKTEIIASNLYMAEDELKSLIAKVQFD